MPDNETVGLLQKNEKNYTELAGPSHLITYIISIAIIIVLMLVLVIVINKNSYKSTTVTITIPSVTQNNINAIELDNFIINYNPNLSAPYYKGFYYYSVNGSNCSKTTYIELYHNLTNPNISVIAFSLGEINSSDLNTYYNRFYSNKGYCRNYWSLIIDNSTENTSTYRYDNLTVYQLFFRDFNQNGNNLIGNSTLLNITDRYMYLYTDVYKNIKAEVSISGRYGYQNQTRNRDIADSFFSSFMSKLGS